MSNLINFVNTFLSYFVLLAIIVVVAGIALTIGITLAKRKNAKASANITADSAKEA